MHMRRQSDRIARERFVSLWLLAVREADGDRLGTIAELLAVQMAEADGRMVTADDLEACKLLMEEAL